jgi:hypothetical protein
MLNRLPYLLSILAFVGGTFIAILFGANESIFKDRIADGLSKNVSILKIADSVEKSAKISSEKEKNWRYYQRYHFHSMSIGTVSLSLLLFLAFVDAPRRLLLISSYFISVGGFLYPFVWLFAGIFGPEIGREVAKEQFAIFGYMGGVHFVGILFALFLAIIYPWKGPLKFSKEN